MIRVFHDVGHLSDAAAAFIDECAEDAFKQRGEFHWLLSGGSTPQTTYHLLAGNPYGERLFWRRTHFYWADERCVPPESDQSNYHLAKEALLDLIATPDSQIHRMPADAPDKEAAAAVYEAVLPERPDLILLGMGPEGHTASLFPNSPALYETRRRVVPVEAPAEPPYRLTVTPPLLKSADEVLVLVEGAEKAEALEKVFLPNGDVRDTPARLAHHATWFVDRAAARLVLKMNLDQVHEVYANG
jgi:6-phosphogluconolactonase